MNKINTKKIILDFGTNTLASMIVVLTMQLIIYPLIAKSVSIGTYGLVLTVMAIVNTVVNSLGNTLNNIRLVENQLYEKKGLEGDFNVILMVVSILGAIIISLLIFIFKSIEILNYVFLIFTVILGIIKSYCLVYYRLKLNFTLNLICNIVITIGYIIGAMIFLTINIWAIPFLMGEVFGLIFLLFTTKILDEPMKVTPILKKTLSSYLMLILTGAMATALSYMDRLIIFPFLGGEAVSTFTVASFFGKSLGLVMIPIASVLLGYYAQESFKFTLKLFWKINIFVLVFSGLFFIISCIASDYVTGILYPTIIEKAKPYILIANTASIISISSAITQPAVLKLAPMLWQTIIQLVYSIIYIILGVFLLKHYGIYGFCVAIMIANIVRLLLLYIVGHVYLEKGESI